MKGPMLASVLALTLGASVLVPGAADAESRRSYRGDGNGYRGKGSHGGGHRYYNKGYNKGYRHGGYYGGHGYYARPYYPRYYARPYPYRPYYYGAPYYYGDPYYAAPPVYRQHGGPSFGIYFNW